MIETNNVKRPTGLKVVIILYIIDAAISLTLLARGTSYVAVNGIGVAADFIAIAGLWSMKRWGAAFTIVVSGKGIGQSILNLQNAYLYLNLSTVVNSAQLLFLRFIMPCLTIGTDIFIVIYLFRKIFAGRFK